MNDLQTEAAATIEESRRQAAELHKRARELEASLAAAESSRADFEVRCAEAVSSRDAAIAAAAARYAAALAASEGHELLVSCSDDLTLMLWRGAADKKPVARMTGHQGLVNHLSFSPDGRYIASAAFDKKVKLWDGRTGKFLVTFVGHVASVYQVAWAPDSRYLASAAKDSTIKLWPAAAVGPSVKPVALHTLAGHADEVYALDWAPAGETLASGSKDRLVKMCVGRARSPSPLLLPHVL